MSPDQVPWPPWLAACASTHSSSELCGDLVFALWHPQHGAPSLVGCQCSLSTRIHPWFAKHLRCYGSAGLARPGEDYSWVMGATRSHHGQSEDRGRPGLPGLPPWAKAEALRGRLRRRPLPCSMGQQAETGRSQDSGLMCTALQDDTWPPGGPLPPGTACVRPCLSRTAHLSGGNLPSCREPP